MIASGNLFSGCGAPQADEVVTVLADGPGVRIERIVSTGQASPDNFWYDQPAAEWVVLLTGSARLRFADEPAARELSPGDWVHIPPHVRHRVEATDPVVATVWLAVHHG
ncbi:Cupin 2, barrel domain protein [Rhodovulum sp. PH10]|uniref:cupin domain-containing protein n=1 Tax=Rhodovulum sp. PH10 TaxID=1187851 RepID=UPI00027C2714|nr:cupin domain-containing protein [Rhodovulum sp. PH10]EJW13660.1 Cupin 2, barrel domain protein [Rhodovulum sp. PH10]